MCQAKRYKTVGLRIFRSVAENINAWGKNMKKIHVNGTAAGEIILYALSTCVWCRKTKKLLNELGVGYDYIDVDLLDENEKPAAEQEIKKWNPGCSFPTLVKDNKFCIVGYKPEEIKEKLKNGR